MATTIPRTPWIDDDGSGTTGTVLNNAIKTELYNQIDTALASLETSGSPVVSVVTTSGTIAVLPIPTGTDDLVIMLNPGAPATIQGITAGRNGQRVTLINNSPHKIDFVHMSSGAGNNALLNLATSAPTSLMLYGSISYIWEAPTSAVWRLASHEQGAYMTPPFNAANFSADAGGTWTVASGAISANQYKVSGKTLHWVIGVGGSTFTGTNILQLQMTLPGGYTGGSTNYSLALCHLNVGSVSQVGEAYCIAGTPTLLVRHIGGAQFSSGTVGVSFELSLPIT